MATHYRREKIVKLVKRIESRIPVSDEKKAEALKEVVAEIRHEFKLKEDER